ncbi:MAG: rRNA (uracil1498-N3)-methyltransferase [Verrucomicrobiota bacterium]|jgi:16S rRNA (uracil1498-N3)-methyltransferase
MHRFHVPPGQCLGNNIVLEGREAHHALRVLRLRPGDAAIVLDGAGLELACEVEEAGREVVRLGVTSRRSVAQPPYQITLLQALPKGKLINSIIEKATELGVARIVPLLSARVVAHFEEGKADSKREHWQGSAIEAIKQCGSAWLPAIEAPLTPADFLKRAETFDLHFIASLQAGSRHPGEFFDAFRQRHGRQPASVGVWVGPEGDFTPEETAAILAAGASAITLGPLVLRADTAAVYCLSVLSYELQADAAARG